MNADDYGAGAGRGLFFKAAGTVVFFIVFAALFAVGSLTCDKNARGINARLERTSSRSPHQIPPSTIPSMAEFAGKKEPAKLYLISAEDFFESLRSGKLKTTAPFAKVPYLQAVDKPVSSNEGESLVFALDDYTLLVLGPSSSATLDCYAGYSCAVNLKFGSLYVARLPNRAETAGNEIRRPLKSFAAKSQNYAAQTDEGSFKLSYDNDFNLNVAAQSGELALWNLNTSALVKKLGAGFALSIYVPQGSYSEQKAFNLKPENFFEAAALASAKPVSGAASEEQIPPANANAPKYDKEPVMEAVEDDDEKSCGDLRGIPTPEEDAELSKKPGGGGIFSLESEASLESVKIFNEKLLDLKKSGKLDEAIAMLKPLIDKGSKESREEALYFTALAYEINGNAGLALEHFAAYTQTFPKGRFIHTARSHIEALNGSGSK